MILEMLGLAGGALTRLVPEVLKFMDRRGERGHELSMFDKQLRADELKGAQRLAEISAQAESALNAGELTALIEATRAQGARTGVPFVDAINALMRPLLTFWWCVALYTAALWAQYHQLTVHGLATAEAILRLWGPEERLIANSIISFWFVDRSLRKGGGVGAAR